LDWYFTAFELIDLRSFSNLWFWIMLAVFWSTASHFVLGVPFDMVARAGSNDEQAQQDLADMVRVHSNRLIYIAETSGMWLTGFTFFLLTGLMIAGFYYWLEFAQALFLLGAPMSLVFLLSVRSARKLVGETGETLRKRLKLHRLMVQVIGMLSILVTSMWGMYINLSTGVLGG
jgi:Zn-dependent protease